MVLTRLAPVVGVKLNAAEGWSDFRLTRELTNPFKAYSYHPMAVVYLYRGRGPRKDRYTCIGGALDCDILR